MKSLILRRLRCIYNLQSIALWSSIFHLPFDFSHQRQPKPRSLNTQSTPEKARGAGRGDAARWPAIGTAVYTGSIFRSNQPWAAAVSFFLAAQETLEPWTVRSTFIALVRWTRCGRNSWLEGISPRLRTWLVLNEVSQAGFTRHVSRDPILILFFSSPVAQIRSVAWTAKQGSGSWLDDGYCQIGLFRMWK